MKNILKYLLSFLESENGETSSRRLIFILSGIQLCLMTLGTLIYLLVKEKYPVAFDLLKAFGSFVLISGGFVTADIFKKK